MKSTGRMNAVYFAIFFMKLSPYQYGSVILEARRFQAF
jgi:hypothetical protein